MPMNCFCIFSMEYSPLSPPVQERTTSFAGSVIVSAMRAQRSCGASPETIASAPATWLIGFCCTPSLMWSTYVPRASSQNIS